MPTTPDKNEKKKAASAAPKVKVNPKLAIVQDVIRLMDDAGVSEISFEQKGIKVHVRKGPAVSYNPVMAPMAAPMAPAMSSPAASAATATPAAAPAAAPAESGNTLKSPMVGTFYRAASPDAKPFIEEGSKIEVGQVYCIIEAMKLMNEVKSEVAGKVVKILAQNGQAVEFNQPLIVVDPS